MLYAGGFKLRWATVVTVAFLAMVMATRCNVMGSDSGSASGSGDYADEAGVDGEDILFGTLDSGKHSCKKRMRGCPEDARWCTSLNEVQSRDPEKCCDFPECPN